MSALNDRSLRNFNTCGCCEGITVETPVKITNRPGMTAIAYRVGTHMLFKQSMLARLSSSDFPALKGLRTRNDDDFSISLLDAWSTVADVLTFYQERIANESYISTATERRSLLELARLIGYELRPGVAASTFLAFTVEEAPGTPDLATKETTIDIGTKVQSVPGPEEKPQIFETVEKISARPEWNEINPRLTKQQPLYTNSNSVTVIGTDTNLKQGDRLLIVVSKTDRKVRLITHVETQEDSNTTYITLGGTKSATKVAGIIPLIQGTVFSTSVKLTETTIQNQIFGKTWESNNLLSVAAIHNWSIHDLVKGVENLRSRKTFPDETGVFALRKRVSLFGYNAPKQPTYKADGTPDLPEKWADWSPTNEAGHKLYLDNAYDEILPGSYIAIHKPGNSTSIHIIDSVRTFPRTEYGISGKTTEIILSAGDTWWNPNTDDFPVIRGTTVDILSDRLELAEIPILDPVHGNSVLLVKFDPYFKDGQTIILSGEPTNQPGVIKSEVMTIGEATVEDGFTKLTFTKAFANQYILKTVVINANVSRATHGETVSEISGSGDASQPYQRFMLRQSPLTYVSAPTPSGSESTLSVRVNDLQWHELPSLYSRGPDDWIFTTRIDDDDRTTIQFGDGITGKRLPSGQENVRATYRKGMGLEGLVKAGQLTTLLSRPLGVKEVTNPLDATGAENRETLNDARRNAPLTVLTLDRAVSLRDYEDFARAFAGIAKAQAIWIWDNDERRIFITVAGPNGAEIKPESDTYTNLLDALRNSGDPHVGFRVKSYRRAFFRINAGIIIHSDYMPEKVLESVEQSLRKQYSFEERTFGQPVHLSEITAVIQSVPGIVAVDVNKLYRLDKPIPHVRPRLESEFPLTGERGEVIAAEMLTMDPGPIDLEEMP
jgi:hypothetical protein